MINKSYKIWIIIFVIINLVLLVWSLGYFKFLEEKLAKQAVDLALLSHGLLKGEDLTDFVERSFELI